MFKPSFKATIICQVILLILDSATGVLSYMMSSPTIILCLTVDIGILGIILIYFTIQDHYGERDNFRNGIISEIQHILESVFSPDLNDSTTVIPYPCWSSKTTNTIIDLLGKDDYNYLKIFYDVMSERNDFFRSRLHTGFYWPRFKELNKKFLESFTVIYERITWLHNAISKSYIDNLLSRVKNTVLLK